MDVFYEESAVNQNAKSGARRYKIVHSISIVFLVLSIVFLMICLFTIPFGSPSADATADQVAHYETVKFICFFCGIQSALFLLFWFVLRKIKTGINVSYDYCFVSGELRVSKVININRRRLVARIDCADMIQVGDIDNSSYERFKADPTVKEIVCTSNDTAAEGKFFMYVLANMDGKKLYILECRENLLMNIMKFAKRSVLESDYVMQERKQK